MALGARLFLETMGSLSESSSEVTSGGTIAAAAFLGTGLPLDFLGFRFRFDMSLIGTSLSLSSSFTAGGARLVVAASLARGTWEETTSPLEGGMAMATTCFAGDASGMSSSESEERSELAALRVGGRARGFPSDVWVVAGDGGFEPLALILDRLG